MQVAPPGGQNWNPCKWHYMLVKFGTNASGVQVIESIPWVHCAPGIVFMGPRYPWSNLWVQVFLTATLSADFTHVTLADEDNNSIPTDDVNRAIIGNVAKQVAPPGSQTCNY